MRNAFSHWGNHFSLGKSCFFIGKNGLKNGSGNGLLFHWGNEKFHWGKGTAEGFLGKIKSENGKILFGSQTATDRFSLCRAVPEDWKRHKPH